MTDQLARSWYAPPGTWSARYRGHAGGSYRELGTVTLRVGEPTTIGE